MHKIHIADVPEQPFTSPKGKFACVSQCISESIGRVPRSDKKSESHPFDVELCRIPPGTSMCPYHSHTTQFEYYIVLGGRGRVRHADGFTEVGVGDHFYFRPGEAHQLFCEGNEDFVIYIIADDPPGDGAFYPDSGKYSFPQTLGRTIIQGTPADYFDGEE